MFKKSIALLFIVALMASAFGFGTTVFAEEQTAHMGIQVEKISDSLYALKLSLMDASDLYGISFDYKFDQTKLEVVKNAAGDALNGAAPVVADPTYLGAQSRVLLNGQKDNSISFMQTLHGNIAGANIAAPKQFATIYFKVKSGQTFTGFGSFSITDSVQLVSPQTICLKLSDSAAHKIQVSLMGLPQDVEAVRDGDPDGVYFAGGTFKAMFTSPLLAANQYQLVIIKPDQTTQLISGATFVKDQNDMVTVTAANLPALTSRGVMGLLMTYNGNTGVAKFKEATMAYNYEPAYSNALVTITPALNTITNYTNTNVALKFTFGTQGSIEVPAGLNLLGEIDKLYHLQDYVQILSNVNNSNLYSIAVDDAQLPGLTQAPATVVLNNVVLDAVKVKSDDNEAAINVNYNAQTKVLSFAVPTLTKTWTASGATFNIALELSVLDWVTKGITLQDRPGQLIIQRAGTTYRTIDFTALGELEAYGATLLSAADVKTSDTCYVKIAGYRSSVYTFSQNAAADETLNVEIDLNVGNLNGDNKIDALDLEIFSQHYGKSGLQSIADINNDGLVNVKDLFYMTKNYK